MICKWYSNDIRIMFKEYQNNPEQILTAIVAPFLPIPPVRIVATFPDKIKDEHEHTVLKHNIACLIWNPEIGGRL